MTTVEREPKIQDKAGLDYSRGIIPYLPQEVSDFETEVTRFQKGGWEDPLKFTAYRLVRGIYGQRQPDVHMVRIKMPSGSLTADQLEAVGEIVDKYVPLNKGHVTTRENIQLHFVKLEDTPDVMRMLGEVGLSTREACGNTVRNVIGCPLSGVTPDEPFYVGPYLAAFARWFVRHPQAQALPRKMKCAFASCNNDCVVTAIHDLAFKPKLRVDENGVERRGFEIITGGGTSIMPRLAYTLYDFVPVEDYLRVSEAIIRIFNRTDELRRNRMKARIKFYIDRVGIDAFREEVEEELKQPWAQESYDPTPLMELPPELIDNPPAPVPAETNGHHDPAYERWLSTNVRAQKQDGYNVVTVKLPLGDISTEQFPILGRIAREFAGGRVRTTVEQNLVYRWVPTGVLKEVWRQLKDAGLGEAGPEKSSDVVSCPGTDSCKLGITSSMGLGQAVGQALKEAAYDDPLVRSLHVKISGCPNGCARHHIANIGFHGAATRGANKSQIPSYELFIGGSFGSDEAARFGKRVKTKVPAKKVPSLVQDIVRYYQAEREPREVFNRFVDRVGTEPFETLAGAYKETGPLNQDTIGTYMDWGKTRMFKVERGEGECAV